jgi:hypothetical protein
MKRRLIYLAILVLVVSGIGVLFSWAQSGHPEATIEELYRLLTTEDGQSRLELLEQAVAEIDEEVNLVHAVAEKMLEEEHGFFEEEKWTLDDLKFQLDRIEGMLQELKGCLACP